MAGFFSKLMGKAGSEATVSEPAQPENPFDIDYGPGEDKDSGDLPGERYAPGLPR